MNSELIKELEGLNVQYRVLDGGDFSGQDRSLPAAWRFVLSSNCSQRVKGAILQWQVYSEFLPQFFNLLKASLVEVRAIELDGRLDLVYLLNVDEFPYLYCGGNPMLLEMPEYIQSMFECFPEGLKNFYRDFHNGFGYALNARYGPLSTFSFFSVSEGDWSNMKHADKHPFGYDGEKLIVMYADPEFFLVVDASAACKVDKCVIWGRDEAPRLAPLWQTLDQNMVDSLL